MKRSKITLLSTLVVIVMLVFSSLTLATPRTRASAAIRTASRQKTAKRKYASRSASNRRYFRLGSKALAKAKARYRRKLYRTAYVSARKASSYFSKVKRVRGSRRLAKKASAAIRSASRLKAAKRKYAGRSASNKRYYRMGSLALSKAKARYRRKLYRTAYVSARKASSYFSKVKRVRGSNRLAKKAKITLLKAKRLYSSKSSYIRRMRKKWLKSKRGRARYRKNRSRLKKASSVIRRASSRYRKRLYRTSIVSSNIAIRILKSIR